MEQHSTIPEGYDRIKLVHNAYAFLATDFEPKANVVLYPRTLHGDFDTLAARMAEYFEHENEEIFIKYKDLDRVRAFQKTCNTEQSRLVSIILSDMEFLHSARVKTHLRILTHYCRDSRTHRFHVDGECQDFDRYMTCYNNPVTQFVRNEDVLLVNGHDAHVKPDAQVFQFNPGDVWKARVRNKPRGRVAAALSSALRSKEKRAFVHRAQVSAKPRLLVVGDRSF